MKGARGVLINITGGLDMTLFEVDEAANRIREEVDPDANIIFGSTFDEQLAERMRISILATGIGSPRTRRRRRKEVHTLKVRVLSIPAIRDRVVQGALKLILEPIFEADFQPGSFGYRPKRTAQ